ANVICSRKDWLLGTNETRYFSVATPLMKAQAVIANCLPISELSSGYVISKTAVPPGVNVPPTRVMSVLPPLEGRTPLQPLVSGWSVTSAATTGAARIAAHTRAIAGDRLSLDVNPRRMACSVAARVQKG